VPAPIAVGDHIVIPATALHVSAARSSGPGGQNVNKVASKVDVRVDLDAIVGLDDGARARLVARVRTRLDADGRLQVISQRTRDQAKNLADAFEKIRAFVAAAIVPPTPRRPTRPTRSSVRARLDDKRQTSQRKRHRAVPDEG
jgi:ribosome-associated protein